MDRRTFVGGSASVLLGTLLWPLSACRPHAPRKSVLPDATVEALEGSKLAYISPLLADGKESFCHGAIWFTWLDGTLVSSTGRESWRSRSITRGFGRARIWVGDYGRWRQPEGVFNEAFRQGPSFDANATVVEDASLLDRLLELYAEKYGEAKIRRWGEQALRDYASGERVLLRYEPLEG